MDLNPALPIDVLRSFSSAPHWKTIRGPFRLVRFLADFEHNLEGTRGNLSSAQGRFWIPEIELMMIHSALRTGITGAPSDPETQRHRFGIGLRLFLRDLLAVRRDWTGRFDSMVRLSLSGKDSIFACSGRVASQPVYSDGIDGAERAKSSGLMLRGGFTQYYIDFRLPQNIAAKSLISPPIAI